jgi:hypothetical protein
VSASPSSVLTRGLGAWGSASLLVTRGFGVGPEAHPYATWTRVAVAGSGVSTVTVTATVGASMPRGLILRPATVLPSRANRVLRVSPVELGEGQSLADWDSFKLTVREDPDWRRGWWQAADDLDPYYDSWALVYEDTLDAADAVVEETVGLATVRFLEFPIAAGDIDLPGGVDRYAYDVRAYGGVAGESVIRATTWLTITPRTG